MKKNIIAICCCFLFMLPGCIKNQSSEESASEFTKIFSPDTYAAFPGYSEILEDYNELVEFRLSANFEQNWNSGNYITTSNSLAQAKSDPNGYRTTYGVPLETKWSNMVVSMTDGLANPTKSSFGYVMRDINHDNQPELFWIREDKIILAVFTIQQDSPILLDVFTPRYKCVVTKDNNIYTISSGGAAYIKYAIRELSVDGFFRMVRHFGIEGFSKETDLVFFEEANGAKVFISESRFDDLLTENPFEFGEGWINIEIILLE